MHSALGRQKLLLLLVSEKFARLSFTDYNDLNMESEEKAIKAMHLLQWRE